MENFPPITAIEYKFFHVLTYYMQKVEKFHLNFPLLVLGIYLILESFVQPYHFQLKSFKYEALQKVLNYINFLGGDESSNFRFIESTLRRLPVSILVIYDFLHAFQTDVRGKDTYRKHSVSEPAKNQYFQVSTEMSDRVDYLRVSLSAVDGECGIVICTGIGADSDWDLHNYLHFESNHLMRDLMCGYSSFR